MMTRTTRFLILVVLRLPTFGSNFATLRSLPYLPKSSYFTYLFVYVCVCICKFNINTTYSEVEGSFYEKNKKKTALDLEDMRDWLKWEGLFPFLNIFFCKFNEHKLSPLFDKFHRISLSIEGLH